MATSSGSNSSSPSAPSTAAKKDTGSGNKLQSFAASIYKPNTTALQDPGMAELQEALGVQDALDKYGFVDPVDRYQFADPLEGIMKKIDYKSGYISPDFQPAFVSLLKQIKAPTYYEQPTQPLADGAKTAELPKPINNPDEDAANRARQQAAEKAAKEAAALEHLNKNRSGAGLTAIGEFFNRYKTPMQNDRNRFINYVQDPIAASKFAEMRGYSHDVMRDIARAKASGRNVNSLSKEAQNLVNNTDIWKWL